jgi:hypothetical protein
MGELGRRADTEDDDGEKGRIGEMKPRISHCPSLRDFGDLMKVVVTTCAQEHARVPAVRNDDLDKPACVGFYARAAWLVFACEKYSLWVAEEPPETVR